MPILEENTVTDYSKLFIMETGTWPRMLHLQALNLECDARKVHTGLRIPETPVRFKRFSGKRYGDFHSTTHAVIHLMSARIDGLLRKEGFTGWKPLPAEVLQEDGTIRTDYFIMTLVGRCGKIDRSRSKRVMHPPEFEGAPRTWYLRGLCFTDDEWDGSDIFCPLGSGYVFITEEVKNFLKAEKIQNIRLTKLTEFEILHDIVKSDWEKIRSAQKKS